MIEPGIYPSLSNEAYHADPAISRSGIKMFCESPFKYWANYLNPARPPVVQTDSMIFGSAFHKRILEPASFYDEYIVEPVLFKAPKWELLKNIMARDGKRDAFDKQKKVKEEWERQNNIIKEEWEELAEGKIILSRAELDCLQKMEEALMNHPQAWDLIQGATYEQSYFWQDEHSGLMVKARPDILRNNGIIDLKTCVSADSHSFQRDMAMGMYHVQGAMCREGIEQLTGNRISTVLNISIEKTYPYAIGIKIISQSALEAGHAKFKQALLDLKNCMAENKWESYQPEEVELPNWSK